MRLEWKVDAAVQRATWGPVSKRTRRYSTMVKRADVIVDLGGGAGWFGLHLARRHSARVICVDLEPRPGKQGVDHLRASALDVPVKDSSADIVTANAILHHVPDDLDKCVSEAHRVLRRGGIFVAQEPLAGNPLARLARGLVTTDRHEEGERPLPLQTMTDAIGKRLRVVRVDHAFLTSYLLPHVQSRVPGALAGCFRRLTLFLLKLDKKMLSKLPSTRKYAAYATMVARKG